MDDATNSSALNDVPIAQSAEHIQDDIEATRGRLSDTLDEIHERLNPAKMKASVAESIREATVGKAHELQEKAAPLIEPLIESVQQKLLPAHAPNGEAKAASGPLKPISQQVVVVFGASSGIGRETALQFAKRGAKVVVAARGQNGLDSLVEDIQNLGGEALAVVADAADFAQVQNVAAQAAQRFGRIDTWVHAAAVSVYARFEDTTPDEFRRVLEVNLLGQIHGALAALPHLRREGRGTLIHISSVESQTSLPLQSAYACSKHGMVGFLDALRMELENEGVPIFVADVKPAGINTPLFNHARTKLGVKPQPAPPVYQPGVVAEVILHAAEHPTREITAGGAAQMFLMGRRLSPALSDSITRRVGVNGQMTNEPKDESAPDNLFEPLNEKGRIGGDFGQSAKSKSLGNLLETNANIRRALKGAALLAAVLFIRHAGRK